jgi:L-iditol 2-dehydrogenase
MALPDSYANSYPAALALLSSGALEGVEKMITHRLPLTESKRAFDIMKNGVDENGRLVVKVCIDGEL